MTDPFATTAPILEPRATIEQVASGKDSPHPDSPAQDRPGKDSPGQDGWYQAAEEREFAQQPMPTEPPRDWAWVEEWRAGREPVPWGPGLALAVFTGLLVATAVYVLSSGLADRPLLAVAVNVVVAAGLGPALWLSRSLPVLRWIAGGAVLGVVVAWLSVLVFLV